MNAVLRIRIRIDFGRLNPQPKFIVILWEFNQARYGMGLKSAQA